MTPNTVRIAGKRVTLLESKLAEARERRDQAILDAYRSGVGPTQIAAEAGITRQAVHNIVNDNRVDTPA